jgi:hypothetical protein
MCEDLSFLSNYPEVQSWLGFSTELNPFLVPPEILLEVCLLLNTLHLFSSSHPPLPLSPASLSVSPPPLLYLRATHLSPSHLSPSPCLSLTEYGLFSAFFSCLWFETSET